MTPFAGSNLLMLNPLVVFLSCFSSLLEFKISDMSLLEFGKNNFSDSPKRSYISDGFRFFTMHTFN